MSGNQLQPCDYIVWARCPLLYEQLRSSMPIDLSARELDMLLHYLHYDSIFPSTQAHVPSPAPHDYTYDEWVRMIPIADRYQLPYLKLLCTRVTPDMYADGRLDLVHEPSQSQLPADMRRLLVEEHPFNDLYIWLYDHHDSDYGYRVPCIRDVVQRASPVIAHTTSGNWIEGVDDVVIPPSVMVARGANALHHVIYHMYTAEIPAYEDEELIDVYMLANHFQLPYLMWSLAVRAMNTPSKWQEHELAFIRKSISLVLPGVVEEYGQVDIEA